MPLPQSDLYTVDDIYALPDGRRAELIDGQIYDMAPPNTMHQRILMHLSGEIRQHIRDSHGSCEVFPAPFAVFLNKDDRTYVEPDISVICDRTRLDDRGCNGAPDWVIEIISPRTERIDYGIKLFKYRSAGVREYWILNASSRTVNVYDFERDERTKQYTFDDEIRSCVCQGLTLNLAKLLNEYG